MKLRELLGVTAKNNPELLTPLVEDSIDSCKVLLGLDDESEIKAVDDESCEAMKIAWKKAKEKRSMRCKKDVEAAIEKYNDKAEEDGTKKCELVSGRVYDWGKPSK